MSKGTKLTSTQEREKKNKKGIVDRNVRFKCCLTNTIYDVLKMRGWQEVSSESNDWDFYWADVMWMKEHFDNYYMEEHLRINHFRNHYELTRKNLMVKNLKRMKKAIEREQGKAEAAKWEFFPMTFELPSEYHIFVEEFKRNPGQTWIMKPIAKSQGKGIFLFQKLKDITEWRKVPLFVQGEYQPQVDQDKEPVETYIVQRYLANPYLIGGRKFDLRVYLLVTSYIPLRAWLYREGFARLSNTRYSLDTITDTYVHLTNVAIQKTAPDYDPEKGSKWSVHKLRQFLNAKHGIEKVDKCFQQMDEIFIRSVQSVQRTIINDKHCFELYGYDILLDSNLKPWLLEINASPSLTASSPEDYELKVRLLDDVLNVIDMEGRLSGQEKRVGGFDLLIDDTPVVIEDGLIDTDKAASTRLNSFLGCLNDRKKHLKDLFRSMAAAKTSVAGNT